MFARNAGPTKLTAALLTGLVLAACSDPAAPPAPPVSTARADISGPPPSAVYEYTAEDLGALSPGATAVANAINDGSMVVGWSLKSGTTGRFATIFQGNWSTIPTSLGRLTGTTSSEAMAVNGAGHIVGSSGRFAFYFSSPGGMQKIPMPSNGDSMVALGINSSDVVVGWYSRPHPTVSFWHIRRAFKWSVGSSAVVDLHPSSAYESEAMAINDAGEIAGVLTLKITTSSGNTYVEHALRWSAGGTVTDLNPPGQWTESTSASIGPTGTVGGFVGGQGGFIRPKSSSTSTIFSSNHGPISGISEMGRIVGVGGATAKQSGLYQIWTWKNLYDLAGGQVIPAANGVNKCGHIVGGASDGAGGVRAVLWRHASCD